MNAETPRGDWSLKETRDWLDDNVEEGVTCPCCHQYAKIYPRSLPSATCRVMIVLYKAGGPGEYVYLPPILDTLKGTAHQGGYGTFGHHWGLLEQMPGERDDGSNRVGWWRLTALGRQFVRGTATVPQKALIYNGKLLELYGPEWTIEDALRSPFNYRELMGED